MSDIVEAMRYCASIRDGSKCDKCWYDMRTGGECVEGLLAEAADEIEMLRNALNLQRKLLLYLENECKKHEWISVDKELPDAGRHIFFVKKGEPGYGYLGISHQGYAFYDDFDDCEINGVTHWMPLPDPPKGAEE